MEGLRTPSVVAMVLNKDQTESLTEDAASENFSSSSNATLPIRTEDRRPGLVANNLPSYEKCYSRLSTPTLILDSRTRMRSILLGSSNSRDHKVTVAPDTYLSQRQIKVCISHLRTPRSKSALLQNQSNATGLVHHRT